MVPDWKEIISEAGEPDLMMLAETHVLPDAELPEMDGYDVVANVPRSDRFCNARAPSSEKRNTRRRSKPQGAVRNRQSGWFM
jgi:hypothetical protein